MSVRLRLARRGAKKRPFYWIVAAESRAPRDGRFLEKVGTYDPMRASDDAGRLSVDRERAERWIERGARPSDRAARLLAAVGIGAAPARREQTAAHLPKAKARERAAEAAAPQPSSAESPPAAGPSTDESTAEAPPPAPEPSTAESTDESSAPPQGAAEETPSGA